jgi:glycosyltransferase involved in cell wall biosynthesis
MPEAGTASAPDPQLPLVSIITPALNAARFIEDTLRSVHAQDYPNIEHVVVDGGSEDGTLELVKRAPGVVWTSGKDAGMYDAINTGLRMARGEIVAYQNSDDRYVIPDAVSSAVRYLLEHPETDVVYGDFRYIDEEGRPVKGGPMRSRHFDPRMLLRYNFIPPHCTFLRIRIVREEGLWLDPTLRYPGDWDWFVRMALAGKAFAHIDKVLSEFRLHKHSQTATVGWLAKLSEWRRICRKNRTSFPLVLWYEAFYVPLRRRLGLAP